MGIAVGKPYHQVELQSGHQGYSSAHGGHQGSPGYLAPHPVSHARPKGTPGQHAAHRSKSTEFLFDDAPPLGPPHQVPAHHHIQPPDLFNTNNHHSRRYRYVQGHFLGFCKHKVAKKKHQANFLFSRESNSASDKVTSKTKMSSPKSNQSQKHPATGQSKDLVMRENERRFAR